MNVRKFIGDQPAPCHRSSMRNAPTRLAAGLSCCAFALASCHSHPDSPGEQRAIQEEQRTQADQTLLALYRLEPPSRAAIESAPGFAVFNEFDSRLTIVGTGRGRGVAFDNRHAGLMYMRVGEFSVGLGPALKKINYVLVFSDPAAFDL